MRYKSSLRVPLQFSILSIFVSIFLAAAGGLVVFSEYKTTEIVVSSTDQVFHRLGREVTERLRRKFEPLSALVELTADLPSAQAMPQDDGFELFRYFVAAQRRRGHVDSLFIGYDSGDFVRVLPLRDDAELRTSLGAPPDSAFGLQTIRGQASARVERWIFFDDALGELGRRSVEQSEYDPRVRPWFQSAMADSGLITTSPYVFARSREIGVTLAKRLSGGSGVVGADLTLDDLSSFLNDVRTVPSMRIAIFSLDSTLVAYHEPGKVVASAGAQGIRLARVDELAEPALSHLLALAQLGHTRRRIEFTAGGEVYLAGLRDLPDNVGRGQFVAMAVPRRDLLVDVERLRRQSLLYSALGALIVLPIIYFAARSVARPLRRLADETDRIRRFDLAEDVAVDSRVTEVSQLADGLGAMKEALRGFGRYVPAQLVRNIVQHGLSPVLGGERKTVTLLFSDVKNFTTMAESMAPEDLMAKVSLYLTDVGAAVIQHGGTIDKYIGDAIMAFWNAPQDQPDHVVLACRAVLAAAARSAALDTAFVRAGEPEMFTRFGLHTGDVVVGNVGSSDRMNYTALGGNVNLAARLEGLNKNYGTQILVSQQVKDAADDQFLFRSIDLVVPKGTSIPSRIYTLVGELHDPDGGPSRELLDLVQGWEAAFALYEARRWSEAFAAFAAFMALHPDDQPARIFHERAARYLASPPPADWNGAEVMLSK